jgi:hypothetical protein
MKNKLTGKVTVYESPPEPPLPKKPKLWQWASIDGRMYAYNGTGWVPAKGIQTYDAGYYYCPLIPDTLNIKDKE